jgi:hypothetical protein
VCSFCTSTTLGPTLAPATAGDLLITINCTLVQGETNSASSTKERTPIPLDMTDVTVTLWSIEAFGL